MWAARRCLLRSAHIQGSLGTGLTRPVPQPHRAARCTQNQRYSAAAKDRTDQLSRDVERDFFIKTGRDRWPDSPRRVDAESADWHIAAKGITKGRKRQCADGIC